tara:strand:+ start:145 stop:414 length:270 start_codon:yes stop_codon:yes gene_type:complete
MATKKLDKEHLEQISDLRKKFADNAMILGNLSIEEFMHTKQLEYLNTEKTKYLSEVDQLKQQESELIVKLRERYGDGEIDTNAGTFIEV